MITLTWRDPRTSWSLVETVPASSLTLYEVQEQALALGLDVELSS